MCLYVICRKYDRGLHHEVIYLCHWTQASKLENNIESSPNIPRDSAIAVKMCSHTSTNDDNRICPIQSEEGAISVIDSTV